MYFRTLLFVAAVCGLTGPALAQEVGDKVVVVPPAGELAISPEDVVRIERYVHDNEDVPVIEDHLTLRPGSVIPEGVSLQIFNKDTGLSRFAYFVSVDNKVVVADPRTRTVVRILDKKN